MQAPSPSPGPETSAWPLAITSAQMQAWTATEAVASVRQGVVTAQSYLTAMLDRAKALGDLNAMITVEKPARAQPRSASMPTVWRESPWVCWRAWSSSSRTTSTARV